MEGSREGGGERREGGGERRGKERKGDGKREHFNLLLKGEIADPEG